MKKGLLPKAEKASEPVRDGLVRRLIKGRNGSEVYSLALNFFTQATE